MFSVEPAAASLDSVPLSAASVVVSCFVILAGVAELDWIVRANVMIRSAPAAISGR